MRVLVTGASGMLGGELATALHRRGDEVTVLQRRGSGRGLREVLGDITDAAVVSEAVRGADAVIHCAAKVNVTGAWRDYHRINVLGTQVLIDVCRRQGVPRLVQVSSPSVAHSGDSLVGEPAGAADPRSARGNYARSKAMAECLALAADARDELAVVAIRPHLVWGPGDTQLVARIVRRARAGRLPVIGSGAPLVDTIYVDNAVDALIAAVDRCDQVRSRALVVTNGEPRPIAEILAAWANSAGAAGPSRRIPAPLAVAAGSVVDVITSALVGLGHDLPSDPPITRFLAEQFSTAHWFDQRESRELLDWVPRISLDEGFARLEAAFAATAAGDTAPQ